MGIDDSRLGGGSAGGEVLSAGVVVIADDCFCVARGGVNLKDFFASGFSSRREEGFAVRRPVELAGRAVPGFG